MSLEVSSAATQSTPAQSSPCEVTPFKIPMGSSRLLKITAGPAGARGRGIFATAPIQAGEVIDSACTVELSEVDCDAIAASVLDNYYFAHPTDENGGLLVVSLISLANHDPDANAQRRWDRDPELGWIITLIAVRDIAAGEEVTHRYACGPWFAEA